MLVVALHAALLVGLPQLRLGAGASRIDVGAFTTRRIAAPAPTVDPATEPPPRPTERPTAKALPPKPAAAAKKRESAPPQPATAPGPTRNAGPISSAEPSLLNAKPTGTGSFGGLTAPTPIEAPMSASATEPALALAQTLGDTPVRIPRAAELTYQAQGTIGGQAFTVPVTLQWRQDGHWYESRFGFYNPRVGERTRQVAGLITPQGLAPAVVQMRVPDAQDIRFDYGSGRVSFSASGTDAPLVAGMQDRLSVLIQLGALLAGDPERYPVGSAIVLPAAHERSEGSWRFAVESDESVTALRDKTIPTVHLVHIPLGESSARIEVWLGRSLDYLPVRLRTVEPNGDTVEYNALTAYAQPTPTASAAPSRPAASTP